MIVLHGSTRRSPDRAQSARQKVDAREEWATTVGPWQLTALLHHGRRLMLYRAKPAAGDAGIGCYALKTPLADGDRRSMLALLRREVAVSGSVQQVHLASVLAAQTSGELPYVVLPLLEGLTVDAVLAAGGASGRLPPITYALWVARQVAEALCALHTAGWLHGQVRPHHIVVSPQGHATLLDLSQCRRIGTDEALADTPPDSPTYAAPEMFAKRSRLSPASDLYCLGVVLSEMLTGKRLFAATDAAQLAILHREVAIPDIRALRPQVPRELATLLRMLLAKEPLRRPSAEQLVRWLTDLEIAALQG